MSVPWVQFSLFLHSAFIRIATVISVPCFYLKGAVFLSNDNLDLLVKQKFQQHADLSGNPNEFFASFWVSLELLCHHHPPSRMVTWGETLVLSRRRNGQKVFYTRVLSKNRHSLLTDMELEIFCHLYFWPCNFLSALLEKHETLSNISDQITIEWELGDFGQLSYSVSLCWRHLNLFFWGKNDKEIKITST